MIIGVGTDIVELARIEKVGMERLIQKVLTPAEQALVPTQAKRRREYVAGRFAAKEAIAKALGTGLGAKFAFTDVEIIADPYGAPKACWVHALEKPQIHLSISHSERYAVAMVVLEQIN